MPLLFIEMALDGLVRAYCYYTLTQFIDLVHIELFILAAWQWLAPIITLSVLASDTF